MNEKNEYDIIEREDQIYEKFWEMYHASPLPDDKKGEIRTIFFEDVDIGLERLGMEYSRRSLLVLQGALAKAKNSFQTLEKEQATRKAAGLRIARIDQELIKQ